MKDIFLLTSPFTQLNTPYPATAYLKGFFNTKNISSYQADLGIEVVLRIFSKQGLQKVFDFAFIAGKITSQNSKRIFALKNHYINTVNDVILFLQGKNPVLARQISNDDYLPQASKFQELGELEYYFGTMGIADKAMHLATLYLEDIADFIKECVDENFEFSRYAEKLGLSANTFDEIYLKLQQELSFVDNITLEILDEKIRSHKPKIICISVPFPGNLFSAFRCAQYAKANFPSIPIIMGGGFANTELRSVSDIRVFDFFDFITLDDGELPLEMLIKRILENDKNIALKRTFYRHEEKIEFEDLCQAKDYKQTENGIPDYSDLPLKKYISVIQIANPMHSLWTNGRWNKLTLAHGCYWGKCTFCDGTLDYIKRFEPVSAKLIVDKIEKIIEQTGEKSFHFVDEAAPPVLMRSLALELIKRKLNITWWTNIRFEKNFNRDLCILLRHSGCIAVSGGLEVASDRLLKLINKGVTVEQVAQVTHNFTDAGIMVHAYLMYGFPGQTDIETVDSLEMVRQMFESGIIQSAFWHQFSMTTHSPIGKNPSYFGLIPQYKEIKFADNDVSFKDSTGIKHEKFSFGLKKSLYNFMHGIGFDFQLQEWFDFKIPKTKISPDYIENCILNAEYTPVKETSRLVWLGGEPEKSFSEKIKKGNLLKLLNLNFHDKISEFSINIEEEKGEWLLSVLKKISVFNHSNYTFSQIKADYETQFSDFEIFWYSKPMDVLRKNGLLVL